MTKTEVTTLIPRVGQLDAALLDAQLLSILREPLDTALGLFKTPILAKYNPELTAAFQLLLLSLSLYRSGATYGLRLQNLTYRPSTDAPRATVGLTRRQTVMHALLTVGLPWFWTRATQYMADHHWGSSSPHHNDDEIESDGNGWWRRYVISARSARAMAWKAALLAEPVWSAAALANFVRFLATGRYRSLPDRILGLVVTPQTPASPRRVSYAFLHRQVLWNSFTEFLLFVLPLYAAARPTLRRAVRSHRVLGAIAAALQGGSAHLRATRALQALPPPTCPSCMAAAPQFAADPRAACADADLLARCRASMLVTASCGCIYCYVCAAARTAEEADDVGAPAGKNLGFRCIRCGTMTEGQLVR